MTDRQTELFEIIFDKDDLTWQTLIMDLIKREGMNPWDIDISVLTNRYIEMLNTLKKLDFRVSGKVVLAAAILLKIKSNKLVGDDIDEFNRLMQDDEEMDADSFYDEIAEEMDRKYIEENYGELIPRTPQPRKRKVSILELMGALQKALEVKERRVLRHIPPAQLEKPIKKVDLSALMNQVHANIMNQIKPGGKTTFTKLLPDDPSKEDKFLTFVPLLHLAHVEHRKIDLFQEKNFDEIDVTLISDTPIKHDIKKEE